jgi:hypothetical protein
MNKIVKVILVSLIFLLFVPSLVSAAQNDLTISNLVFLKDKKITAQSCGNVIVVYGSADIQTNVNGNVIVVFGKATVNGKVSGDVVSILGELDIKDNTSIEGNLVSYGRLVKGNNVEVSGLGVAANIDFISLFKTNGVIINTMIAYALFILIAGLILISVFTARYRVMSNSMGSRSSRRMLLGVLVIVGCTIILAFMVFMIAVPILYTMLLVFADIVASIYVGSFVFKNNHEKTTIYLQFFLGHIMVSIIKIVPLILLPEGSYMALMIYGIFYLILQFTMSSFGMGTVIDTAFGRNKGVIPNKG